LDVRHCYEKVVIRVEVIISFRFYYTNLKTKVKYIFYFKTKKASSKYELAKCELLKPDGL